MIRFCMVVSLTKVIYSILGSAGRFADLHCHSEPHFNWLVATGLCLSNRSKAPFTRDRIHLDPIHFLRGVYTGSDPELLAFTWDRIHLDFMKS